MRMQAAEVRDLSDRLRERLSAGARLGTGYRKTLARVAGDRNEELFPQPLSGGHNPASGAAS